MDTDAEIMMQIRQHLENYPQRQREMEALRQVVFGNQSIGEKGMKQKVDEMHTILTQAKGLPWIIGFIVLFGSFIAVLKVWLIK